jgi:hypothetical protein
MIFLILFALLLAPPLVMLWLGQPLSPPNRLRTGLGIGLTGALLIVFPFLQGAVENAARRLPVPVAGTTEMGRRAWVGGPHEINLIVSVPEDGKSSGELADVEWEVRQGDRLVARGNPSRDGEKVDPALQRQADQMAERGRALRAKQGLPPLPVRPPPKARHVPIGSFDADFGRYYTVTLTPRLDPRLQARAYVVSTRRDGLAWSLSLFMLGCGLVLGGAVSAVAGRVAQR